MKKKESSTGNNNTYQKEQARHLKRIRQFIKDAEKRGYHFYDTKIPKNLSKIKVGIEDYVIPKTVKNPTAVTVKRLEKITKEYLYERALWIDPETDSVYTSTEGRRIERSRAAKKGAETRKKNKRNRPQPPPIDPPYERIFDRVRGYLELLQNATTGWPAMDSFKQERGRYLVGFLDDCIEAAELVGRLFEYSEHLNAKAEEISRLVDATLPESKQEVVESNVGGMLNILNEGAITPAQSAAYHDVLDYGTGEEEMR